MVNRLHLFVQKGLRYHKSVLANEHCGKVANQNQQITEIFINHRIILFDKEKMEEVEGCLSIPDQDFMVERFYGVEIIYQGINGKAKKLRLLGFNARVIQHESDHLNGVLISQIWKMY